ncbi:MAG: putative toxin-antitoxin system toxin component, PIN family [Bdellovibrionaceae bacterium]|nr:putative toxin-antitoxin system toxin component, PIN family [Pseudobdellovibrionaceae bacterium]
MPKPLRLVVDTNIIVSGLITKGTPPAKVLDAVHTKKITLLISDEVLTEYLRVLEYPHIRKYKKITDEAIGHLTALFINETERVEVLTEITKSPDPDDNKFLSLAVDGQADYLITGDKADLLSLKEISGIKIITAKQAMEKLKL